MNRSLNLVRLYIEVEKKKIMCLLALLVMALADVVMQQLNTLLYKDSMLNTQLNS